MNFVIYAPGDFTINGGGCIALHKLCHNIASLGERAFIMTGKKNPNYLGEVVSESQAIDLCQDKHSIAIYPEVTCHNPFHAKNVMRWILYFTREYGDHGLFSPSDLVYKYAPIYTLRQKNSVTGELRAMELNLNMFIDRKESRSGTCFLKKKNQDKPNIHPENSLCIDNYTSKGGFQYLAEIFNKYETFYAYDDATWVSIIAALCGCKSIVIPRKYSAGEWYSGYPYFKYGISYGLDDINMQHAANTLPLLRNHLLSLEWESIEQTKQFILKAKSICE
jgi:hypothetical protein